MVVPGEFKWTGKLTLKGETKPVSGTGSLKGDTITANFKISLSDYPAIGVPSWLGVTVEKDVLVKAEIRTAK